VAVDVNGFVETEVLVLAGCTGVKVKRLCSGTAAALGVMATKGDGSLLAMEAWIGAEQLQRMTASNKPK
jgi:hypothetical protein